VQVAKSGDGCQGAEDLAADGPGFGDESTSTPSRTLFFPTSKDLSNRYAGGLTFLNRLQPPSGDHRKPSPQSIHMLIAQT
jgi:hypothetical protein